MNAIRTGLTSVTFRQKTIDEIVALAHKAQLDGIAVSYTHLTLPTILLV